MVLVALPHCASDATNFPEEAESISSVSQALSSSDTVIAIKANREGRYVVLQGTTLSWSNGTTDAAAAATFVKEVSGMGFKLKSVTNDQYVKLGTSGTLAATASTASTATLFKTEACGSKLAIMADKNEDGVVNSSDSNRYVKANNDVQAVNGLCDGSSSTSWEKWELIEIEVPTHPIVTIKANREGRYVVLQGTTLSWSSGTLDEGAAANFVKETSGTGFKLKSSDNDQYVKLGAGGTLAATASTASTATLFKTEACGSKLAIMADKNGDGEVNSSDTNRYVKANNDVQAVNAVCDGSSSTSWEKWELVEIESEQCGNATVADQEECDDGNTLNGDGCSAVCLLEPSQVCGNGAIEAGEECDDGNVILGDGCDPDCVAEPEHTCGNGVIDAGEHCDDGNESPGDGCGVTCVVEAVCGNGLLELQESCDDGNVQDFDGCSDVCTVELPECGNGFVEITEECDDGNSFTHDGCDSLCNTELPVCGNGIVEYLEDCDTGSLVVEHCAYGAMSCSVCDATCSTVAGQAAYCGDGVVAGAYGELCDDGNVASGDGCNALCAPEVSIAACFRIWSERGDDWLVTVGSGKVIADPNASEEDAQVFRKIPLENGWVFQDATGNFMEVVDEQLSMTATEQSAATFIEHQCGYGNAQRVGYEASAGTHPHWKNVNPGTPIRSGNGGNSTVCNALSATTWEGFYLVEAACPGECSVQNLPVVGAAASSIQLSHKGPLQAVDDDQSTRWSSQFSDPQWIALDLGARRHVSGVDIKWEAAASANYEVQLSQTGVEGSWYTLYSDDLGNGGFDQISGLDGEGRYVRIFSHARLTQFGNSIYEVDIYGDLDPACAGTCGDGIVAAGEECDDSNALYGDGCTPACESESKHVATSLRVISIAASSNLYDYPVGEALRDTPLFWRADPNDPRASVTVSLDDYYSITTVTVVVPVGGPVDFSVEVSGANGLETYPCNGIEEYGTSQVAVTCDVGRGGKVVSVVAGDVAGRYVDIAYLDIRGNPIVDCSEIVNPAGPHDVVYYPYGTSPQTVAVSSSAELSIGDGTTIVDTAGEYGRVLHTSTNWLHLARLGESVKAGDVLSSQAVYLGDGTRIYGDVQASRGVQFGPDGNGTALVSGIVEPSSGVVLGGSSFALAIPPQTGGNLALAQGAEQTAFPGGYGGVNVSAASKLRLSTGTYVFETFRLAAGGALLVDDSAGPVVVFVKSGQFIYRGEVVDEGGSAVPRIDFLVVLSPMITSAQITGRFVGTLFAQNGDISVGASGVHRGAFFGRNVHFGENVHLTHVPFPWHVLLNHCTNGIPDCGEDSPDCGFPCGGCYGSTCSLNSDCTEGAHCVSGMCGAPSSCTNGELDNDESDVDCGGSCVDCLGGAEGEPPANAGCDEGLALGTDNGGYFGTDPNADLCWGAGCPEACTTDQLGQCGNCSGNTACVDDLDCRGGWVCSSGMPFGANHNVCTSPICVADAENHCGPGELCGQCLCEPDCEDSPCGGPDGCGEQCPGACAVGEPCSMHSDCVVGLLCSDGECVDSSCSAPNCGVGTACGPCPLSSLQHSVERRCGIEPVTGTDMGTCDAGLACVASTCIVDTQISAPDNTSAAGEVAGTFAVTTTGESTYNVAIDVPPGRLGAAPALSLGYSSFAGNGLLGFGWHIGGLSYITRCSRPFGPNGDARGVGGDSEDEFCLDGQRLTTDGIYGADGTEYRTLPDSYSRIVSHGGDGNPSYFIVQTRDGRRLTYGASDESSVFIRQGVKRVWALERSEDYVGNFVSYQYQALQSLPEASGGQSVTAEIQPRAITYGGFQNGSTSLLADRLVSFEYEMRPDKLEAYRAGVGVFRNTRLNKIRTYVGSNLLREYRITYEDQVLVTSGVSRLKSIEECAPSGGVSELVCKAPTVFHYANGEGISPGYRTPEFVDLPVPSQGGELKALDVDADGKDDLAIYRKGGYWDVLTSGVGRVLPLDVFVAKRIGLLPESRNLAVADLNGDGRDDLLRIIGSKAYYSREANGIPWMEEEDYGYNRPDPIDFTPLFVVDTNGDGLSDLVERRYRHAVLNSPHGFQSPTTFPSLPGLDQVSGDLYVRQNTLVLDVDGDISPDIIYRTTGDTLDSPWTVYSTGKKVPLGFEPLGGLETSGASQFVLLDVNGDGLRDILTRKTYQTADGYGQGERPIELFINTGAGFESRGLVNLMLSHNQMNAAFAYNNPGTGREVLVYPRPNADGTHTWWTWWATPQIGLAGHTTILIAPVSAENPTQQAVKSGQFPYGTVADIDGDGVADMVLSDVDGRLRVYYGGNREAHLLERIVTGLGNQFDIEYKAEAYSRQDPSEKPCKWPTRCLGKLRRPPVSQHAESVEFGQRRERAVEYLYFNAREDFQGRGSTGFARRIVVERDGLGNLINSTEIDYDNTTYDPEFGLYPFAGRPKRQLLLWPYASSDLTDGTPRRIAEESVYSWRSEPNGHRTVQVKQTKEILKYFETRSGAEDVSEWEEIFETETTRSESDYGAELTSFERVRVDGNVVESVLTSSVMHPVEGVNLDNWLVNLVKRRVVKNQRGTRSDARVEDFEYDEFGMVTFTEREPFSTDLGRADNNQQNLKTTYEHNEFGNVVSISQQDENGETRATTISYDNREMYRERIYLPENLAPISYDFDGRHGLVRSESDPNGLEETWRYDGFGRMTSHQHPSGRGEAVRYDVPTESDQESTFAAAAVAITVERSDLGVTRRILDSAGRLIHERASGYFQEPVIRALGYDRARRLEWMSRPHVEGDSSQGFSTFEYDAAGRLRVEKRADDVEIEHSYATRLSYLGPVESGLEIWIKAVKDGEQNVDTVVRDHDYNVVANLDSELSRTTYEYGAFGTLVSITDEDSNVVTMGYDKSGRLINRSDPDTGVDSFSYNAFGELKYHQDAGLDEERLFYDSLGRLRFHEDSNGLSEWRYDGSGPNELGRLVEATRHAGADWSTGNSIAYAYEAGSTGRLSEIVQTIDTKSFSTRYEYTAAGQLDVVHYPEAPGTAFAVKYGYDASGNLIAATNAWNSEQVYWNATAAYQGYALSEEKLGDVITTGTSYEHLTGLPSAITSTSQGAVTGNLQNVAYDYYANYNLKQKTNGPLQTVETYDYDSLDRLIAVETDGQESLAVTYDALGNITYKSDVGEYGLDTGRPHAVATAGLASFQYDARGNVRHRVAPWVPEGGDTLEYTSFNLPFRITQDGGTQTDFDYSAHQSRIRKTSATRDQIYVGEIYERAETLNSESVDHIYKVLVGDREVARVVHEEMGEVILSTSVRYILADRLGSGSVVVDEAGSLIATQNFDPFGASGSTVSVAGFTGHEHDDDLKLINMRGRVYDPVLSRFLSPDPLTSTPFWSQGLNRYSYVSNNPLNLVDPSGYTATSSGPAVGGGGGPPNGWQTVRITPAGGGASYDTRVYFANGTPAQAPTGQVPGSTSDPATPGASAPPSAAAAPGASTASAGASAGASAAAFLYGAATGGISAAGISYGLGAVAGICPACAVGIGIGFAAYTIYGLATGGAAAIGDSAGRIASGKGSEQDFETVGQLLGGTAVAGFAGTKLFRAGQSLSTSPKPVPLTPPDARGGTSGQRTVIGKLKDLDNLRSGENTLLKHLPDQGSVRANWAQNSGVLRQEMSKGLPIRDASVNPATGQLRGYPGSFLEAERNLLQSRGWTYNPSTTLWSPP